MNLKALPIIIITLLSSNSWADAPGLCREKPEITIGYWSKTKISTNSSKTAFCFESNTSPDATIYFDTNSRTVFVDGPMTMPIDYAKCKNPKNQDEKMRCDYYIQSAAAALREIQMQFYEDEIKFYKGKTTSGLNHPREKVENYISLFFKTFDLKSESSERERTLRGNAVYARIVYEQNSDAKSRTAELKVR